jgi:uncharacterized protein (TIGR03790 family)
MFGRREILFILAIVVAVDVADVTAQTAENVAVVVNEASADSQRIAEHYRIARGVPAVNVFRINTTTEESIERDAYVRTIEQPLATAIRRANLQDRILYLVLTKGVPLRITGTTGLKGTSGSVDSELTLLYRRMAGQPVSNAGSVDNPYYLGGKEISEAIRFSHNEYDIFLVTRLDAYTADDVIALIDRAQRAQREGRVVLDQRGAVGGPGDDWMQRAAERLAKQGQEERVLLESTSRPARGIETVLGYYAWGSADPENRVRKVRMSFMPGSLAANLASFDARTFKPPPDEWTPSGSGEKATWFEGAGDTLIGDLIRDGVTGVSGQVGEAYVLGAVRPEILFPAYLAGFNLAEAYYLASPTLSWQQVVVGDPLAAPFRSQGLTPEQLGNEIDAATHLPSAFAKRRLAIARTAQPDLPDAALELFLQGETLVVRKDNVAARDAFEKASALAPRSTTLLLLVADLEEKAEAYEAAIARYRRILELQPGNIVALNNIAYALAVRRKEPAEALPFARRAASLAPRLASVLDTLGWIEHLLGNHSVAVNIFADAVRSAPADAEIRLHSALANAAAGRADQAAKELEQALTLDPSLESREEVRRLRP